MSMTYAIPDLHGRIDLLDSAIVRIIEHSRVSLPRLLLGRTISTAGRAATASSTD